MHAPAPRYSRRACATPGFTLVEILVSITILAALATMTSQMIGGAVRVTSGSRQHLGSDAQARTVFDCLSADLRQMLRNPGVDCLFAKQDGGSGANGVNDTFYFCSEAPAFYDGTPTTTARSTVALVGYRVNSRCQLERLGKGLTWDGDASASALGGLVCLTYPAGQATAAKGTTLDGRWPSSVDVPGTNYNEANEPDAHVLADGVFRLEICFLLTDGTCSTRPVTAPAGQKNNLTATVPPSTSDDGGSGGYTVGSRWYDNTARRAYVCKQTTTGAAVWESAGVRDVSALVVSLGLLDANTRKVAPMKTDPTNPQGQVADLSRLQAIFADAKETDLNPVTPPSASNPPKLPATGWLGQLYASNFPAASGLPRLAAGQVRVYQRIIPLTPSEKAPPPTVSVRRRDRRGVALIIVLVLVALLTGILVVFLSRSITDRQIAGSSAAETRTRLLAEGAVNTLLSDLKQEIAAGSTAQSVTAGSTTTTLYPPKTPATMVPAVVGTTGAAGTENLLKRSAYNQPFYGSAYDTGNYPPSNRAANVSSLAASLNGRQVSPARWNEHLLLEKNSALTAGDTNDSDFTPIGASATAWSGAPDWVLVTRDGSAQTAWSSGLIAQNGNNGAVTGRYAYQVFEEGGLLDVNAAGYPSTAPSNSAQASLPSYKASVAFADLTQLPGIGDLPPTRQNNLRDTLVGWRNYASAQPTAGSVFPNYAFNASTVGSYDLFAANHPKGFLSAGNATLYNDQSDRLFSSRQELFKLLLGGFASTDPSSAGKQERASLQNSLRFLTHFSRALEQPSYIPDPNRPRVVDQASSANGSDDGINPSFPAVRVTNTTARGRDDGSDLTVGDPLVKKRFALNRLAWLTYAGPITLDGSTYNPAVAPAMITALKTTYGFTDAFLLQGTPANVYKSFGLSWVADTRTTPKGDGQSKWVYSHTGPTALTSLPTGGPILRVGRPPSVTAPDSTRYVQDLNPGREADFFELLKASVACGSKAKTATTTPTNPSAATDAGSPTFYANQDSSYDLAIIQLGANIIDQFDLDGYATRILFNDGNLLPKEVRGVEDLPYLYRVRYGLVQGRAPVVITSPPPATANNPVIQDTGFNVLYEQPEVWNPHDQNSPAADPSVSGLVPTSFRCVAYSTDPDHIDNSTDASTTYLSMLCNERMAGCNIAPIYYNGYASPETCDSTTPIVAPFSKAYNSTTAFYAGALSGAFPLSPDNAALFFNIPTGTPGAAFFREPTLLSTPNVPAGSNLSALPPAGATGGARNMLNPGVSIGATVPSYHPNIKPYLDTGNGALKSTADNKEYLGFYMTTMPANWYVPAQNVVSPSNAYPGKALAINRNISGGSNNVLFIKHQSSPALAVTYRLQYQDPVSGKWVSYDEKYASLVPGSTGSAEAATTGWSGYGTQSTNAVDGSTGRNYPCAYDPRTSRFGMPYVPYGGSPAIASNADSPPTTAAGYGWISQPANQLVTQRPDYSSGFFNAGLSTLPTASGWTNTSAQMDFGLLTQNNSLFSGNGKRWTTDPGASASTLSQSYADPDGVTRRGMGAYVAGTNVTGLPMATGAGTPQAQSRPIVLNRPFRTVGELGYVFSGTPWKNLDFFTADSGDAALLDVFTINDPDNVNGMVAGRVNLNTRQAPVLQAILAGAYKDEQDSYPPAAKPPYPTFLSLTPTPATGEAAKIAQALVARTTKTNPGQGPLTNAAELVGRYGNASANGTITSRYDNQKFDGFANDLTTDVNGNAVFGENTPTSNIQRLREAPIRALGAAGQTRVWNLLFDVIAQTGRYPLTASKLENFVVEGEQHYWVHVAIDRLTGSVIDKQIEVVKE